MPPKKSEEAPHPPLLTHQPSPTPFSVAIAQKKEYIQLSFKESHLRTMNTQGNQEEKHDLHSDEVYEVLGSHELLEELKGTGHNEGHHPRNVEPTSTEAPTHTLLAPLIQKGEEVLQDPTETKSANLLAGVLKTMKDGPGSEREEDNYFVLNQPAHEESFVPDLPNQTQIISLHHGHEGSQVQENTIQQVKQPVQQALPHPSPQEKEEHSSPEITSKSQVIDITDFAGSITTEQKIIKIEEPEKEKEKPTDEPKKEEVLTPQQKQQMPQLMKETEETKPLQEINENDSKKADETSLKKEKIDRNRTLKGTSAYILAVLAVWVLWVAY